MPCPAKVKEIKKAVKKGDSKLSDESAIRIAWKQYKDMKKKGETMNKDAFWGRKVLSRRLKELAGKLRWRKSEGLLNQLAKAGILPASILGAAGMHAKMADPGDITVNVAQDEPDYGYGGYGDYGDYGGYY